MSTYHLANLGNVEHSVKDLEGFFFVINELNRDELRLYNNSMMFRAWSKILHTKQLLYLHTDKFIRYLFKNLSEVYVKGNFYRIFKNIFFFNLQFKIFK